MAERTLTMRTRATLLVLMVLGTEVSNRELEEAANLALTGQPRIQLNDLKLVESRMVGRSYRHRLTEDGRAWCEEELSTTCPDPRTPAGRGLYVLLNALGQYTQRSGVSLREILSGAPVAGEADATPAARVLDAYQELKTPASRWVPLRKLRAALRDIPRAELDVLLRELFRSQDIELVPEDNRKALTADDHAAALEIGGEDKHAIAVPS
jgi:hypothetical protein